MAGNPNFTDNHKSDKSHLKVNRGKTMKKRNIMPVAAAPVSRAYNIPSIPSERFLTKYIVRRKLRVSLNTLIRIYLKGFSSNWRIWKGTVHRISATTIQNIILRLTVCESFANRSIEIFGEYKINGRMDISVNRIFPV
jgi:hypothetical protein